MTWFVFCYWYEPDAIHDPVGLVRIWSLSRHLARQGDGVTVFPPRYASAKGHREFRTTAVPLLHVPWLRPLSYALGAFVRGVLAAVRARPDVVYYRWMESPHVLLLARLIGSLCVCEISGEPVPGWMKEGQGLKTRIREGLTRLALRRCDRLVVLTEGLRALLVSRYGVAPQRIIVLPSGTDTDRFRPQDRSTCRRRVGLKPDRRYIGFVGTFYRYQGLTDLLEALSRLRARLPTAEVVLVGDGEAAASLREQARRLQLEDAVVWAGRVPYTAVPDWIGAMDLCVAPFRGDRGETSPVKIFDYLACGLPTVATAIQSVSAVFSDRTGVVLVPPDDPDALASALGRLLERPEQLRDLGQRGREFVVQRYSWAAMTTTLRNWIRPAAGPSSHADPPVLR